MSDLVNEIKSDLADFGNSIEAAGETVIVEVYDVLKVAVVFIGSSQARVVLDLLQKIETDSGKSLEQIETDLLQVASADELVILKNAGSQLIQGLIAFVQASKSV